MMREDPAVWLGYTDVPPHTPKDTASLTCLADVEAGVRGVP